MGGAGNKRRRRPILPFSQNGNKRFMRKREALYLADNFSDTLRKRPVPFRVAQPYASGNYACIGAGETLR
jgi:hypothetical protein